MAAEEFFDGHVLAVRAGDANDEVHYNEIVGGNTTPYGWLTSRKNWASIELLHPSHFPGWEWATQVIHS